MIAAWLAPLAAYSLQLGVVVAVGLAAAALCRLRAPRPALRFWQGLLIATLALPFLQAAAASPAGAPRGTVLLIAGSVSASSWPAAAAQLPRLIAAVLALGVIARLAWLGLGIARLRAIRRESRPLTVLPPCLADLCARTGASAEIRISTAIDGPVTFGLRRPAILLPERALRLPDAVQQAILGHELLHVRRRDWLQLLAEQLWCSALWFHPAAHLVIDRIALLREALVDAETIQLTGDRRAYAQALLAFAEPGRLPAAVPSLVRRRHLSRRITLITQEVRMSTRHVTAALVAAAGLVSMATVTAMSRVPITTPGSEAAAIHAAQLAPVRPGNGVSVPRVITERRPEYTAAALKAKIQGDVELDVVIAADGVPETVTVAKSLDGEHGLDNAAVAAAYDWRFEPGRRNGEAVPVIVTLQMKFTLRD